MLISKSIEYLLDKRRERGRKNKQKNKQTKKSKQTTIIKNWTGNISTVVLRKFPKKNNKNNKNNKIVSIRLPENKLMGKNTFLSIEY